MKSDRQTVTYRTASSAKINLFLEILSRRPDGYHTVSTVFQEISLMDTLTARRRPDRTMGLKTNRSDLGPAARNLVIRSARAFQENYPSTPGIDFNLFKRVPVGAGLGGGSANAAAALRACSVLSGRDGDPSTERKLSSIGKTLGADVPFFLRGGLALAGGVGDRLRHFESARTEPIHFVLVFPRVFSSTPEAYRALKFPLTKRRSGLRLTRALRDGAPPSVWAPWIFNRLEEVVVPRLPRVGEAKRALLRAGCLNAMMSGSGSSVFGVVSDEGHGRRVAARLREEPWDVWRVTSVSRPSATPRLLDEVGRHGNHRDSRDASRRRQVESVRHRHL